MIDLEARAADALRRIADRIDVVPDLRAVITDTRTLPVRSMPSRRRSFAVLAGAAAVLVVALVVVVLQRGDRHPAQPIDTTPPPMSWDLPLLWTTPQVRLGAQTIRVQIDAATYDVPASATADSATDSSAGPQDVQRLTLAWTDGGRSIALVIPFSASGTEWRLGGPSLDIDGVTAGRVFQAEEVGAPFGSTYAGDFVASSTVDGVTMSVLATGLQVEGFRNRAADGTYLAVETPPPVTVVAPPLPADVPPTGVHLDPEQSMLLTMGPDALRLECVRRAGFDVPGVPHDVIAESFGGAAGARANGYHGSRLGVLNGGGYGESLSADEQTAFLRALGAGNGTGCWGEVTTAQPVPDPTHDEQSRLWVLPAQVRPEVLADPRVVAVLSAWGGCVEAAIGERAPSPEDLAARFMQDESASHREKQVAAADLACRAQTDFDQVWFTVQTERERALLGPDAAFYDEMARRYQTLLAYYTAELDERGIVLPSLD